jgi:putative acetyltransferase
MLTAAAAMTVRQTLESDIADLRDIHLKAFGEEEGPEIAELVEALMEDATARPLVSLASVKDERLTGHILFTSVRLSGSARAVSASILAPLAVLPEEQSRGVGGALIRTGLGMLRESGTGLVFVLGHPGYYPRYGFVPAGELGFEAPYPVPEEHAAAWMVQELCPGLIGTVRGTVRCSDALDQPRYWRD